MGEGGAPEEAGNRLHLLVSEYEEIGYTLTMMGFNGEVLDLKACTVEEWVFPEDNETAIQALIDKKSMNRPGGLFNIGCLVANAYVVLEASRRMAVMEVEKKKGKEQKKKTPRRLSCKLQFVLTISGSRMANQLTRRTSHNAL